MSNKPTPFSKPLGGDNLNQADFDQFRQFLEEACGLVDRSVLVHDEVSSYSAFERLEW